MNSAINLLRRNAIGHVSKRRKAYLGEIKGSMNDLPQPSGDWKTNYSAQQRKYTAHLALGLGFLFSTLIFAFAGDVIYLNYSPPEYPAAKVDYR